MTHTETEAAGLLARLVEGRNNTVAGVAEDCHGTYCVYCGVRGYRDRPRPDHRRDCPIQRGQLLLGRIYGNHEEKEEEDDRLAAIREIPVKFPG